jgi:subtilisin family serine protease
VVDTGVSAAHPDLTGRVRTDLGATCLDLTPCASGPATDDNGHGTHVAGIAGAATNNGIGVAGVAFSSPIIPVKVLDSTGSGYDSDVADGIVWAAQQGARVINLSLGGAYSQTDCDAVATAVSMGALVVAAAGNSSSSTPSAPAACPGVVGVAATDEFDLPASFSNYGWPNVFVSAPGVDIYSTWPGTYAWEAGTSMASPFVAGVAALRFGEHPESTPAEVVACWRRAPTRSAASCTEAIRTAPATAAPGTRATATAAWTSPRRWPWQQLRRRHRLRCLRHRPRRLSCRRLRRLGRRPRRRCPCQRRPTPFLRSYGRIR